MVKILTVEQIREADKFTIENEPITSIELMERASKELFHWIDAKFKSQKEEIIFHVYCGPGNNGGDGLALSRFLSKASYKVKPILVKYADSLSTDCQEELNRLDIPFQEIDNLPVKVAIEDKVIIIDALFGSGLSRPIKGWLKDLIIQLNQTNSIRIAVDMPSGLFAEDNTSNDYEAIFKADYTLCFQSPRLCFLFPSHFDFVGEWFALDIGLHKDFINELESPYHYLTKEYVKTNLEDRKAGAHKGNFGHALIIAGSKGKVGASILSSLACLRSGVGLLTLHIPSHAVPIIHETIPEVMVSYDKEEDTISEVFIKKEYDSIGVGPGIGTSALTAKMLKQLIKGYQKPIVFDADALNILSQNKNCLSLVPKDSVFTPHPGEFRRLVGDWNNDFDRLELQVNFSKRYKVVVILKGKHSSITTPEGHVYFNSTGNSGMATAGSGDVLTGIITSFISQGYKSEYAAIVAVYLHGLAGDLAKEKLGEESLVASDIIDFLPLGFKQLKN